MDSAVSVCDRLLLNWCYLLMLIFQNTSESVILSWIVNQLSLGVPAFTFRAVNLLMIP